MQGGGVSIRYARALLELGGEEGSTARIQEELAGFAQLYEQSVDLRNVLLNPSIELSERKTLVRTLGKRLGVSTTMVHFLLLLLDKDRIGSLTAIAQAFQRMADSQAGNVRAQVTSAQALTPAQSRRMQEVLSKVTGRRVILEASVDPTLIGGVVTRLGGKVYDGSLSTQLASIQGGLGKS